MPDIPGIGLALIITAAGLFLVNGGAVRESMAAPEDKLLAAGKLKLAGRRMRCGDLPTLLSHGFWDYGGATKGRIILNPEKLAKLSDPVRLYIYAHECGHQLYGTKETRADCYSVQRGRREGWLNSEGMDQICHFLKDYPADWVHPSGQVRCEKMQQCFLKTKPKRAGQ